MRAIIIITFFFVILGGCTVSSSGVSADNMGYQPDAIDYTGAYQTNDSYVRYGPNINRINYNHNSSIGYGGVNVYSYQGV